MSRVSDFLMNNAGAGPASSQPLAAVRRYRDAVARAPRNREARHRLGVALAAAGDAAGAVQELLRALHIDPTNHETAATLSQILRSVRGDLTVDLRPATLAACFAIADVDHSSFMPLAAAVLKRQGALARALALARDEGPEAAAAWLLSRHGRAALADRLLLEYLAKGVNLDVEIERLLTALRKALLLDTPAERLRAGEPRRLLGALALHCANNEYVFAVTEAERRRVGELATTVDRAVRDGAPLGSEVLLYALYEPLDRLPAADLLLGRAGTVPAPLRAVIEATVGCRAEEGRLAETIPVLTAPAGGASARVAAQYEENPYPRWLGINRRRAGSGPTGVVAGHPAALLRDRDCDVLVAGCGTGKDALYAALGYGPRARVLAVDLSRASLAYGLRMARRYGIDNVEFAQADILGLGSLDRRFDAIECTGVLHHLADPLAGWRVLAGLLKPGGFMSIGLYRRLGREPVAAARTAIAALGLGASADEVRAFRARLIDGLAPGLNPGVAGRERILACRDFFTTSECRDFLFHAQERDLTLPVIRDWLRDLGLAFHGFRLSAETRARFGDGAKLDDLDAWWAFEQANPLALGWMYRFWCRKPAAAAGQPAAESPR